MRVADSPRVVAFALAGCALLAGCSDTPAPDWPIPATWTEDRPLRIVVTLDDVGWAQGRVPVVVPLERGPGNPDSIRISELDAAGAVLDREVGYQFDGDASGGELTLLVGGDEASTPRRRYVLYLDDSGTYTPPIPWGPLVEATEGVLHEGQAGIRITAGHSRWFYHSGGAGLASLNTGNGRDWIGFGPEGGAAGEYRGIPNLVYPEGFFHPGGATCTTRIVTAGNLRVVLESECGEGAWAVRWEFFRQHARMTVVRADHPYWFLYEGTPGGTLEVNQDYYVLSNGDRFPASEPWDHDLPDPEWLYFGDPEVQSVLWLAHEIDDEHPDAYYPMEGQMTVFGFGRRRVRSFLTDVPQRFLLGFAPAGDHARIAGIVESALSRPRIDVAAVEERGDRPVAPVPPKTEDASDG